MMFVNGWREVFFGSMDSLPGSGTGDLGFFIENQWAVLLERRGLAGNWIQREGWGGPGECENLEDGNGDASTSQSVWMGVFLSLRSNGLRRFLRVDTLMENPNGEARREMEDGIVVSDPDAMMGKPVISGT
jgi:hypothetical protein